MANGQIHSPDEKAEMNSNHRNEAEPQNDINPTLRSEDSGLGISASPSEQHLSAGTGLTAEDKEVDKEGETMWRRGGSVESLTQSLQDILAFIATRYTRDSSIWVSCTKFRSFKKMFAVI